MDVGLDDVFDSYGDLMEVSLKWEVALLYIDPPYTVRYIQNTGKSNYDVFSNPDMKDTIQLKCDVLKRGGHGHIFPS